MIDLKALGAKLRAVFGVGTPGLEAFEFDTVGADPQRSVVYPPAPRNGFVGGWWAGARRFDIHSGRLGNVIEAWSTTVHTTDMAPGTMAALLKQWRASAGRGAGAHFLIGKQLAGENAPIPTGGIVQLAPITRNANHAGGSPGHGWFLLPNGRLAHPNSVSVGIEIDNAGRLVRAGSGGRGDAWVHRDSGKVFAPKDVYVDARGRGWERVTDYQMSSLVLLLDVLDETLVMPPKGVIVIPNGTYQANGALDAVLPGVREVGHWTLDPTRKSDPGPQVTDLLRARAAARS